MSQEYIYIKDLVKSSKNELNYSWKNATKNVFFNLFSAIFLYKMLENIYSS
jgi:hypothetical protein